ncbi:MAG: hypothetical protein IAI50_16080 [Candidatus Eremiobacteraeota bacterium]|nr:hypothetical protein [Candidatus Eremiobacteraeota bacterium]
MFTADGARRYPIARSLAEFGRPPGEDGLVKGYESRTPGPHSAPDIFAGDLTSALPLPQGAGTPPGKHYRPLLAFSL